jgi:hypothetical protein
MLKSLSSHIKNFPDFFSFKKSSSLQSAIFDVFLKLSYKTRDYIDVIFENGQRETIKLTSSTKHLLNFCLNDATFAKSGKFNLTIPEIARKIGFFCEKTIIRAFAQIKRLGILRSYPRYSKHKRVCRTGAKIHVRVANCYYLTRKLLARLIEALQTGFLRPEPEPEHQQDHADTHFEKKIDQYGKCSTHRIFKEIVQTSIEVTKGKDELYYFSEYLKNNESLNYVEKIMRENGENNAAIQEAVKILPKIARSLRKFGKINQYLQKNLDDK